MRVLMEGLDVNREIMRINGFDLLTLIRSEAKIINIPADAEIIAIHNDYERNGIALCLEHESFVATPKGGILLERSGVIQVADKEEVRDKCKGCNRLISLMETHYKSRGDNCYYCASCWGNGCKAKEIGCDDCCRIFNNRETIYSSIKAGIDKKYCAACWSM